MFSLPEYEHYFVAKQQNVFKKSVDSTKCLRSLSTWSIHSVHVWYHVSATTKYKFQTTRIIACSQCEWVEKHQVLVSHHMSYTLNTTSIDT